MSAACIILDALARAERDAISCATVISGLLATSQLRNAIAPRISVARSLTAKMFNMVAAAPTAWCTAHVRLVSTNAAVLQQTPVAFVQLRSISVDGAVQDADRAALTAMPALLNQRTLREIAFSPWISVTDAMLRDGLASVTARLETLIIGHGSDVTDAGLASLRGTPMIATLRKFSLAGSNDITDAGVAALLGSAPELRSLTLTQCALLSGAFLTQLHEHCDYSLAEIDLNGCTSIDNAGAAALCTFRGLTELGLSHATRLSVLPRALLSLLRAVKDGFLSWCRGLKTLELSALIGVASFGNHFLAWCSGLATLDLSGLTNVASVGNYFMCGCSSLTTLDLSGLTNLARVGNYFLMSCSGLTTLDLAPLTSVTIVGYHFLRDCSGLHRLRLSVGLLQNDSVLDEHKQLHAQGSAAAALSTAALKNAETAAF